MNRYLTKIVIQTILKYKKQKTESTGGFSTYQLARGYRELKINIRRYIKDAILITTGIFSAAFGFKGFLLTNHFIDGGATGISLLINALSGFPLPILLILVNLPFILMGSRVVGRPFAIKTALAISGLALCVGTVEFPNVTNDNLLVAIFGGFFLGAGIGLSVRGGAVIDGTEVLAIYLSRKLSTTIGDIIILINILIFSTAAYFLTVEIAMYSMITYLAASKTLDFLVEGLDEYIGVTIVSPHHEEILDMLINTMKGGITVFHGKRGFGKRGDSKETDIIYTVITRLEINKLNNALEKIDPNAFVVMNSVKDTKGGIVKKRPLH